MTLVIYDDAKGLWIASEGEAKTVPFRQSSADIAVTDGSGRVLEGRLLVNGTPFPVVKGKCKILTEAFHKQGFSDITFISESGVKRPCAYVRQLDAMWYFPSPREALGNDEIISLLRKLERLQEKLESARMLCSDAVSSVLGI